MRAATKGTAQSIALLRTAIFGRWHVIRRASLAGAGLGMALLVTPTGLTRAESAATAGNSGSAPMSPKLFETCKGQTYALCAVANCFVFNGLAYCKCDVESGDSISLRFRFDQGQDVCTINAKGPDNGYMVSTFSVPKSVVSGGDRALYTCSARTSDGAYAQCDGGICFTSTEGQSFPGFAKPLDRGEIVCSCPITVADPTRAKLGYQIAGPFPCQKSFYANCKKAATNKSTGATVYVGAPIGTARFLARQLNGTVPPLNECPSPGSKP